MSSPSTHNGSSTPTMWWFPRLISPEANEALVHLPEVGDTPPRPTWDGGVPRRRLRDKTAVPQLSMLHMEGEGVAAAWIHTRLAAHRHHFDAIAPNAPSLFSLESWRSAVTVGRLKRPRGHRPRRLILRGVLNSGSMEVDSIGGGEKEEAPNNQDGGSCLVASTQRTPGKLP